MKTFKFKSTRSVNLDLFDPSERQIFEAFPEDYRMFLQKHNGGWLSDPSSATYSVPIKGNFNGNVYDSFRTEVEEFWSFISYDNEEAGSAEGAPTSILHETFDTHLPEGFLPTDVIVIGRASRNSLFAISLRDDDVGCIYHWDWYWRYPWNKPFFDERISAAVAGFPDALEINDNPDHPEHQALMDAANYATLVKVADSFSDFLDSLRPKSDED